MLITLEHLGVCDGDLCYLVSQYHLEDIDRDRKVIDILSDFYDDRTPKNIENVYASYICDENVMVRIKFNKDKTVSICADNLSTSEDKEFIREGKHKRGNIKTLKIRDFDKVLNKNTKWIEKISKTKKKRSRSKATEE